MDDYQKEIADLEVQVEQLVEAEGDAKTIAEPQTAPDAPRRHVVPGTGGSNPGTGGAAGSKVLALSH